MPYATELRPQATATTPSVRVRSVSVSVTNANCAAGIFFRHNFLPVFRSTNTAWSQTPSPSASSDRGGWMTTAVEPSAVTCRLVAQR